MVIVSHQRDKCIGCNYCVELLYSNWRMSTKDGKATLIGAKPKKGFYTAKYSDAEYEENKKAAEACPVKIIQVKKI